MGKSKREEQCEIQEIEHCEVMLPGQRTKLPIEVPPIENYSLWEIIKPNLGKDFSKFKVPVSMNEPVTMLQRLAEAYMAYIDLIELAAQKECSLERMELVTAYAISGVSTNRNRLTKPFNPLLLETFELERAESRFLAEQVSHHPPVSAIHVEGPGFIISGTVAPKVSFWMNRLICYPNASIILTFSKFDNESYNWDTPACTIHNIMIGKPYMNVTGSMMIKSSSGHESRVSFDTASGWGNIRSTDLHFDAIINYGRTPTRALYGNWSKYVASCPASLFKDVYSNWQKTFIKAVSEKPEKAAIIPSSTVLWTSAKLPEKYEMLYHFTFLTLALNELTQEIKSKVPPSDSRYRMDVAKMEQGKIDEAAKEKEFLENVQRWRRKEGGKRIEPKWFTKERGTWTFNTKYWERNYDNCERIFESINESNSTSQSVTEKSSSIRPNQG